jgi:hypothetical protein
VLALFSLAALVAFCVVGAVVGWRVRRLARATGGAAERWVALCLLSICGVAYPLLIAGQALPAGAAHVALVSFAVASLDLGLASMYLFTREVYRRDVAWLRAALALPFAALVVHWAGLTSSLWGARQAVDSLGPDGPGWTLFSTLISGVGFGWTAVESLAYWALLRRRVALGLADPLVVNRVLLWGAVGLSTTVINLANGVAGWRGVDVLRDPSTMLVTGIFGSFNAVALWLAFLPPERYVRFVRRRAPGASAPA